MKLIFHHHSTRLSEFPTPLMAPNGKTTSFSLTSKTMELVKPAEPTPLQILSFSTIDNDPNLEMICQTIYVYRNNNHGSIHQSPSDPAVVLKLGLSRALVHYHPLAGKLKRLANGKLRITCNADGVPFVDATTDVTLDSLNYLDGIGAETAQAFVFGPPSESEHGYYPLFLQVTKFSCGGFTVGMGLSHSVCDGFGAAQFFRAMAELASRKMEPTIKPVWERERLVGIPKEQNLQFFDVSSLTKSPFLPANELSHECFHIDSETIKRLKTRLTDESGEVAFTTVEILGAYVWRSRFRALKQNPEGTTSLHLAVGIRSLVNPPLPEGYYGNAFVSARAVITGNELDNEPLSKVARLIKQSKKAASRADSIQEWLDFLEAFMQANMKIDDSGASMVLTDWRQLKLMEEVDFGWKGSVNMIPTPWKMIGFVNLCIFLPANRVNPSMEGGIRVLVSLPTPAMPLFKQEMDALKIGTLKKLDLHHLVI